MLYHFGRQQAGSAEANLKTTQNKTTNNISVFSTNNFFEICLLEGCRLKLGEKRAENESQSKPYTCF